MWQLIHTTSFGASSHSIMPIFTRLLPASSEWGVKTTLLWGPAACVQGQCPSLPPHCVTFPNSLWSQVSTCDSWVDWGRFAAPNDYLTGSPMGLDAISLTWIHFPKVKEVECMANSPLCYLLTVLFYLYCFIIENVLCIDLVFFSLFSCFL